MTHKESFLQYLEIIKRYSPNTVRSYKNDLDSFFYFLASRDLPADPQSVTSGDIREWIRELVGGETAAASSTIHRKVSCLRVFFKYLRKEGIMSSDPLEKVVLPRKKKVLPVFVGEKSMESLLDNVDFGKDYQGLRDKTIIELFYMTGMRRAELIGLRTADVDLVEGTVKVTGKRNKQRIIPLVASFKTNLGEYLRVRNEFAGSAEGWFFLTDKGTKMYDKFVYNVVNRYLSMVTTIEKKSPHVMRHTFATHMLNRGADLNSIKELLGHANLSATQVYTHNTFEKLRKVYEKSHPRG
ncbi:MAG TPA: tyrosine-type recombinase/integrase [Bacteroidales bacterium]|nr:tyrosine-type recombinase/integrase [Bacteroidales bacterium]